MKIILSCLLAVGVGIVCVPAFLAYSYSVEKVDCVMLMIGDGTGGRFKGAEQLVEHGCSEILLIPAYNQVAFAEDTGLSVIGFVKMSSVADKPVTVFGRKFRVFENTHLEMLKGKNIRVSGHISICSWL